jgi:uncharacterized metal-binding protein YceD (DUF177 family)
MAPQPVDISRLWPEPVSLAEATRGPLRRALVADELARARIAQALGLDALLSLEADLRVQPWLDGVEIEGSWRARVGQTCGVTLEPFESDIEGHIRLRAAPEGSPALGASEDHELDLDPDAEDPPDVLERDEIDLGGYVVEDLSLAIDPFPRKPGVAFEAPEAQNEPSPFAILAKLKGGTPDA